MALCRLDIPGMMLYGGSIAPGKLNGVDITMPECFRRHLDPHAAPAASTTPALKRLRPTPVPRAGACGGQFTANTMAMSGEILGISPDSALRRSLPHPLTSTPPHEAALAYS